MDSDQRCLVIIRVGSAANAPKDMLHSQTAPKKGMLFWLLLTDFEAPRMGLRRPDSRM